MGCYCPCDLPDLGDHDQQRIEVSNLFYVVLASFMLSLNFRRRFSLVLTALFKSFQVWVPHSCLFPLLLLFMGRDLQLPC